MKRKSGQDLDQLKMYSYGDAKRLVDVSRFVKPIDPPGDLLTGFPDVLAGLHFKELCRDIAEAAIHKKEVVLAMGAHVIKCGLSLLVIDLMERGVVTAVVLNGAGAIHDWEIAFGGATSEDVGEGLADGSFGMCRETSKALNDAAVRAEKENKGYGETLGQDLERSDFPYKTHSILAAGWRLKVPVTLHVSIGCDIVHMQADTKGGSIGAATLTDFRRLVEVTSALDGGVWVNIGSSVMLPEVFLKTLAMARNLTRKPRCFTTADLDMIRHYRPQQNVVQRPGDRGIMLTGHHELLLPLLRWGVITELEKRGNP